MTRGLGKCTASRIGYGSRLACKMTSAAVLFALAASKSASVENCELVISISGARATTSRNYLRLGCARAWECDPLVPHVVVHLRRYQFAHGAALLGMKQDGMEPEAR